MFGLVVMCGPQRFLAGSTSRAAYRDVSGWGEEARQRAVAPQLNLRMEGEFQRGVSSREHYREHRQARTPATIRKQMIPKPSGKQKFGDKQGICLYYKYQTLSMLPIFNPSSCFVLPLIRTGSPVRVNIF